MRVFSDCEAAAASHCEPDRVNIWLNGEQVTVCSNCLEHVAMNGHVEDGELYYDHDN